jgi:hypothetical protein
LSTPVRLRRAHALVILWPPEGPVGVNYFTRQSSRLDPASLALLAALDDWRAPEAVLADAGGAAVAPQLLRLLDHRLVVAEGSDEARQDERVAAEFVWGATAGLFHFGIQHAIYEPAAGIAWVEERVAAGS